MHIGSYATATESNKYLQMCNYTTLLRQLQSLAFQNIAKLQVVSHNS